MHQKIARETAPVRPMWELEREAIANALYESRGRVEVAAKALQIGRATLYRKIKKYKIKTTW